MDGRAAFAGIGIGMLLVGAPSPALCTTCADGWTESWTLEVRGVTVDGVAAEDVSPWSVPTELQAGSSDDGHVFLTVGNSVLEFAEVAP